MIKPILKNSINVIYWISFFQATFLLNFVGLVLLLLLLFKSLLPDQEYDRYAIKHKSFAFIMPVIGGTIMNIVSMFARMESPIIASIIALLALVSGIVIIYNLILMIIFTITELKELKFL